MRLPSGRFRSERETTQAHSSNMINLQCFSVRCLYIYSGCVVCVFYAFLGVLITSSPLFVNLGAKIS